MTSPTRSAPGGAPAQARPFSLIRTISRGPLPYPPKALTDSRIRPSWRQLRPGRRRPHGRRSTHPCRDKDDAEELLTPRLPPFPAYPGAVAAARPRTAGDGYPDHRSPRVPNSRCWPSGCSRGVKTIFKTTNPVIIYTATGTGAWEAALVNTLNAGDRVLMVETGQFATLWKTMAGKLGLKPEFITTDWRIGADPKRHRGCAAQGQGA